MIVVSSRRSISWGRHSGVVLGALAGALMALGPGCSSSEGTAAGTGGAAPTGGTASLTGGASTTGGTVSTGGVASMTGGAAPTGGASTTGGASSAGTAGTTAGAAGSGGGVRPATVPTGDTQADIMTFLKAGSYKSAPWASDSTGPRDGMGSSPHGRVRVWMNSELAESLRAGRNGLPDPIDQWAMAVKEIYDESDAMVGMAASFKVQAGNTAANWIYLCYGPAGAEEGVCESAARAVPEAMPIFGTGSVAGCSCHSGFVIAPAPPAP